MIVQFEEGAGFAEYQKILDAETEREEALSEYYEQISEERVARFALSSN